MKFLKPLLAAALAAASFGAAAQATFPDRPIQLVVPFAAGGPEGASASFGRPSGG